MSAPEPGEEDIEAMWEGLNSLLPSALEWDNEILNPSAPEGIYRLFSNEMSCECRLAWGASWVRAGE